jgi:predicted nucleotidyltransferase
VATVREALVAILSDAPDIGASFALIGGLAVSAWVEPRTTRDVDVAVSVDDDEMAERVVFQLQQRGYVVQTVIEQRVLGRLATARFRPPRSREQGALVDLLFASSGVEREVVAGARLIEVVRGVTAPVARIGHLIALKVLARDDDTRPQDAVDLAALMRRATPGDLHEALQLARRIEALGTHRGRNLVALIGDAATRWRS